MPNDSTNASDNAKMPISAPLYFQFLHRLPKKSMSTNEAAGMAGMIQAWSSNHLPEWWIADS